jgi:hypothetical protein
MGRPITQVPIPHGEQIVAARMDSMVKSFSQPLEVAPEVEMMLSDFEARLVDVDRKTLIAKLALTELARLQSHYAGSENLNVSEREMFGGSSRGGRSQGRDSFRSDRPDRGGRSDRGDRDGNFTGFTLSVGSADGATPSRLIGILNNCFPQDRVGVGKIRVSNDSSFIEVEQRFAAALPGAMSDMSMDNKPILVREGAAGGGPSGQPYRSKGRSNSGKPPYRGGSKVNSKSGNKYGGNRSKSSDSKRKAG